MSVQFLPLCHCKGELGQYCNQRHKCHSCTQGDNQEYVMESFELHCSEVGEKPTPPPKPTKQQATKSTLN